MTTTDHYHTLGVARDADRATIRAAYLRLMRDHHPDRRPGDPEAEDIARRANAAWEALSDSARRAAHDRLRATRRAGSGTPGPGQAGVRTSWCDPAAVGDPFARATWAAAGRSAYSPEHHRVRRDIHLACVRLAAAVLALGACVLLAVG